jgi:glutaredoxin 3
MVPMSQHVHIRVYSTLICPYCIRAKALLKSRGIQYEEIDVTGDSSARAWLVQATGRRTVPQIFFGDEPIGGFDELRAMDVSGELAKRLGRAA